MAAFIFFSSFFVSAPLPFRRPGRTAGLSPHACSAARRRAAGAKKIDFPQRYEFNLESKCAAGIWMRCARKTGRRKFSYLCPRQKYDSDALFPRTPIQRRRLLRLAASARPAVGAADPRTGALDPAARAAGGDRCRPHRYGGERLLLCGPLRRVATRRGSRADGLQAQFPAAGRHLRAGHDPRARRGPCTLRRPRARIPLFHRDAQESLYAPRHVAVLRAARPRADEPCGRLAARVRRLHVVRQAQLEQPDEHLPDPAGRLAGRRRPAALHDPCGPLPAQHGAVDRRHAGRCGARTLHPPKSSVRSSRAAICRGRAPAPRRRDFS